MKTRMTYEDRLLGELQDEIVRREADPSVPAARRPLFTGRRLSVAAAACVVAGLAVVLLPGSPAGAPAYAMERHDDGSVTLTFKDLGPRAQAQRELAERLRPSGVHVDIQNLDSTHACRKPRGGERLPEGKPPRPGEIWSVTLHRGDTVAFENYKDSSGQTLALKFYAVKGAIGPCVPMETVDIRG
ncbi:hypothetical protein [Streptomyces sp. NPDC003015]